MTKAFITPWDRRTETALYDEQFLTRVFDSVTDQFYKAFKKALSGGWN
ncbi:MAG: hypothetical protein WBB70_03120 [Desulfobacterales bacterium]